MELYSFRNIRPDGTVESTSSRAGFIAGKSIPDEPPPPPTFNEEELNAAQQESFQKGYVEGMEEGQRLANTEIAQQNQKLIELLEHMTSRIGDSLAEHDTIMEKKKAELPRLAFSIAKKVAGEALKTDPAAAIEELVHQCFSLAAGEPKLVITVNDSLAGSLEEKLIHAFAGNEDAGEIIITPDAQMALADCRIEWKDGVAERNTAGIWQEVERILGIAPQGTISHNGHSNA